MRWLLVIVAVVVGVVALMWVFQRSLIYLPSQSVPARAQVLPEAEEVTFETADGLTLGAWFLPADGARRGTVIVFNGNAGNRAHRAPLADALSHLGYAVMLVDYRGYGANPGSPSEESLIEDARAALDHVVSRPEVDPARLVYFGESLGAGVALALAQQAPPSALILRSPFTSLADIASVHYPFLPSSLLLWDRYPNEETVAGIESPVLVIAGSADRIVPLDQSRQLYEAAREPKTLIVIEGAGHNDFALLAGEQMIESIADFLAGHLPIDRG